MLRGSLPGLFPGGHEWNRSCSLVSPDRKFISPVRGGRAGTSYSFHLLNPPARNFKFGASLREVWPRRRLVLTWNPTRKNDRSCIGKMALPGTQLENGFPTTPVHPRTPPQPQPRLPRLRHRGGRRLWNDESRHFIHRAGRALTELAPRPSGACDL